MRPPCVQGAAAGFTLIEMLTVLAILALVSLVSLPALRRPPDSLRLESTVRTVAASLRSCRAHAITFNRRCTFQFDVEKRTLQFEGQRTVLDEQTEIRMVAARLSDVREASGQIFFFVDGTSSGGDIIIAIGHRRAKISTNWLTGLTQVDWSSRGET